MQKLLASLAVVSLVASVAGCGNDGSPTAPAGNGSVAAPAAPADRGEASARTFHVTLENLTPSNGGGAAQVLSPPVLATHGPRMRLFRVGRIASSELSQIAEDAVNQPMVDMLNASPRVHAVVEGGGVIPPGASDSFEIEAVAEQRFLSLVSMLVNTNDGFTGVDRVRLPGTGERTWYLGAWDAGSEENTELLEHIPGPCCGNPLQRVPTEEEIRPHEGITGRGDLDPAVWGWDGPVARLTVTRID